jgi:hypothetical protein
MEYANDDGTKPLPTVTKTLVWDAVSVMLFSSTLILSKISLQFTKSEGRGPYYYVVLY